MSLNLNVVMLAGNLTRDPEIKVVGDSHVVNFGLAINRRYKKDNIAHEEVTFVDVSTWGNTAKMIGQYFRKGQGMMVEGRLKLEGWETAAGEKRQRLKVIAERVHFTTSKANNGAGDAEAGEPVTAGAAPVATKNGAKVDDEPPF